jgi:pimeloyl-ACP methyl ester carboxylesterase
VCLLDFPGYGFSDKPRGWGYSLERDAALLDHYLAEVVGVSSAVVVAHDRGSSVALRHALTAIAGHTRSGVQHLVLTNGNIFLPLSNLTDFQRMILDSETAAAVLSVLTPEALAQGMGATTFTPARAPGDPEVEALAATFAHADGIAVLHETIQYLVERSEHERAWLEQLAGCELPTTVIWGMNDAIAPLRVAAFVWNEFLMRKPGRNSFYLVPGANHYLQNDRPDSLTTTIVRALDADAGSAPGPIGPEADAPVLVDVSRPHLIAADVVLGRVR